MAFWTTGRKEVSFDILGIWLDAHDKDNKPLFKSPNIKLLDHGLWYDPRESEELITKHKSEGRRPLPEGTEFQLGEGI